MTEVFGLYFGVCSYDGLDNIQEKDGKTYLYQDPDHVHAVTTAGGSGYAYDANGNMTARPGMTLVWNEENLLAEIKNATTLDTAESGACPTRRRRIYDGDPFGRPGQASNDQSRRTHLATRPSKPALSEAEG